MPKAPIAGSFDKHTFSYVRNCQTAFPKWLVPLYIPTSNFRVISFSSSPAYGGVTIFYFNHFDRYVVEMVIFLVSM